MVVEHDADTILAADHLIDLGPGAGIHGGHIIAEGTVDAIKRNPASITGQYLTGHRKIPLPPERRYFNSKAVLSITGA